jgi:hypothetical protein
LIIILTPFCFCYKKSKNGGVKMVSSRFRAAVKLADRPAWKIAYEAGIHPNVLSKIMSGATKIKEGDERVIRVGNIIGLEPEDCFDNETECNEG